MGLNGKILYFIRRDPVEDLDCESCFIETNFLNNLSFQWKRLNLSGLNLS